MASCGQCTVRVGPGCGAAEISPPTASLMMLLTEPVPGLQPEQKARAQKRLGHPGRTAPLASLVQVHGPGKVRNASEKKPAWEEEPHRPSHRRSSLRPLCVWNAELFSAMGVAHTAAGKVLGVPVPPRGTVTLFGAEMGHLFKPLHVVF